MPRERVEFESGGEQCAAWFYPGRSGLCIVMATGAAVTKEPGTDPYAADFQAAGHAVLAFDYRGFGESAGWPRQVLSVNRQVDDLTAAIDFAAGLPGVEKDKIVAWGSSLGGGHVLRAVQAAPVAAAIAQTPLVDSLVSAPAALKHETLGVVLRFPFLVLLDVLGGVLGRAPRLVPLTGPRGAVAMLTTPDSQDLERALDPDRRHGGWRRTIAARSVLLLALYRPGRHVSRLRCPVLFVVADQDQSVLASPALRAAGRSPRSELVRVPGGHYAPFLEAHDAVLAAELEFLTRQLPGSARENPTLRQRLSGPGTAAS
ncbi:alpha/beta hydrolase [Microlunatus flavus]|nr:alpha/beta fold hydrolase [Microlunatus flavus]